MTAERDLAAGSPERFGYAWHRFSLPSAAQEEQFRRWTSLIDSASGWRGMTFLDGGCGAGRNSYWAMSWGAAGGVAVDVDERALAAARGNLAAFPSVEVRHRSLYDLDLDNAVDIAFSIGVVHHLSDPDRALAALVRAARPGGRVLVWLYGVENMELYLKLFAPVRRALFSRLPMPALAALAHMPCAALWLALRLGLGRIEYVRLLRGFPYRHLHAIVLDQMLPRIATHYTRARAEALLARAGLTDVRSCWVNQMSWQVVGTKPAGSS